MALQCTGDRGVVIENATRRGHDPLIQAGPVDLLRSSGVVDFDHRIIDATPRLAWCAQPGRDRIPESSMHDYTVSRPREARLGWKSASIPTTSAAGVAACQGDLARASALAARGRLSLVLFRSSRCRPEAGTAPDRRRRIRKRAECCARGQRAGDDPDGASLKDIGRGLPFQSGSGPTTFNHPADGFGWEAALACGRSSVPPRLATSNRHGRSVPREGCCALPRSQTAGHRRRRCHDPVWSMRIDSLPSRTKYSRRGPSRSDEDGDAGHLRPLRQGARTPPMPSSS